MSLITQKFGCAPAFPVLSLTHIMLPMIHMSYFHELVMRLMC
jgi:hypothetical protein